MTPPRPPAVPLTLAPNLPKIHELIEERDLTIAEIARRAEISRPYLTACLNGRDRWRVETIGSKVAFVLNVHPGVIHSWIPA